MAGNAIGLIGLCRRAGKTACGEFAVQAEFKRGKCRLLIIAADSTEKVIEHYTRLSENAGVPYIIISDKHSLGAITKGPNRMVIAITDQKFAEGILKATKI